MSITVQDCLKLPSLSLGNVIAGRNGLGNIVNTISVVEFYNYYKEDLYTPNELLITAFYSVKDSVADQCMSLEEYKRSGDVGLVLFYSDEILKGVSPQIIEVADRLNFPIILLPGEYMGIRYSDVISEVMEAVFVDRKSNNFFVNNTMERISQMEEVNRNITKVLSFATAYTKASFFLCDDKDNVIAATYWPITKKIDFKLILYATEVNAQYNIYKTPFASKSGVKLTLYGVSQNNKLNISVMNEVIEVIQLFEVIWNYNLNLSTREAIIPAIIEGDEGLIKTIAKEQQLDIAALNTVIFVEPKEEGKQGNNNSGKMVMDIREILLRNKVNGIVDLFGSLIVIVCGYSKASIRETLNWSELEEYLEAEHGMRHYTRFTGVKLLGGIKDIYLKYYIGIRVAEKIYPTKIAFNSNEISFAEKCKNVINSIGQEKAECLNLLEPIIADPEEDLLLTLSTYLLDADSEVKRTAENLFVHRNTVQYRLTKIKNLLGLDFSKMPVYYEVYFAVAVLRATPPMTIKKNGKNSRKQVIDHERVKLYTDLNNK